MKLTVIGCTGSMSGPAAPASSYLLQARGTDRVHSLVMDLGPGAFGRLMAHVNPAAVDAVMLSHLHADHMSDMISYHVYRRWNPVGALGPVPVWAPADVVNRVRGVGGDPSEETYGGEFTPRYLSDRLLFHVGPFTVQAFAVQHPVEAYAFRISGPSESGGQAVFAYSGDTDTCPGLTEAARGADILLSEAAFVDGRDTVRGMHLTGARAGTAAREAGVGRLILTHIQPWTDPEDVRRAAAGAYSGRIDLATADAVWEL